jgi:hypothetical protein
MKGARLEKIITLLAYWDKGYPRKRFLSFKSRNNKKVEAVEILNNEKIKDEQLKEE